MDNVDGTFIVDVYHTQALSRDPHVPLTTGRLLLWAMLRGGDYNPVCASSCTEAHADCVILGRAQRMWQAS